MAPRVSDFFLLRPFFLSAASLNAPVFILYELYEAMIYVEKELMPLSTVYGLSSTISHSRSHIASKGLEHPTADLGFGERPIFA
jgi:hypothetical protein